MSTQHSQYTSFLADKAGLADLSPVLKALWYDGNGDWKKAHDQVDSLGGKDAARIHAYLHRKEGDLWNADYWYGRSGESRPEQTLDEEWAMLMERYYR
ncbi:hypothetical protein PBT90_12685 [Algoriphagus halophytocola]|uniref:Uncharacterized protein n=1 Tax=Algoriphagus halophytocola TaxID=2991499 RepID=A0ABY6MNH1_9BACT|nr:MULTISPECIES: hypothetical protein [unclassified Algoriphagus]UZD24241.1 hypothetical protein OM944_07010 [Algoriphagus sp. TR-M5]WBL41610.1 hypothetical protein PBT90_12685 [Algoriphagus sp. TR-M9]